MQAKIDPIPSFLIDSFCPLRNLPLLPGTKIIANAAELEKRTQEIASTPFNHKEPSKESSFAGFSLYNGSKFVIIKNRAGLTEPFSSRSSNKLGFGYSIHDQCWVVWKKTKCPMPSEPKGSLDSKDKNYDPVYAQKMSSFVSETMFLSEKNHHEGIIKVYGQSDYQSRKTKESRRIFFYEYCEKGSVSRIYEKVITGRFDLEERSRIINSVMYQMIQIVKYLQGKGIAHRDLKLENFCLTKDLKVKLIDWEFILNPKYGNNVPLYQGTIEYAAPEILERKSTGDLQTDKWALGVALYLIKNMHLPPFCRVFEEKSISAAAAAATELNPGDPVIVEDVFPVSLEEQYKRFIFEFHEIKPEAGTLDFFIASLLHHDPKKRPDLNKVSLRFF